MIISKNKEMNFSESSKYMGKKVFKKKVRLFSITGGNKGFIEIANKYSSINKFAKGECFNTNGIIFNYINDFLCDLSYLERSIISSIGIGNTKATAISNNINKKENIVRETLNNLLNKEIIKVEIPIKDGRKINEDDEIYSLNNYSLNFYFNFIYPYLNANNEIDIANAIGHYSIVFDYQYQGKIFEDICKELFLKYIVNKELIWNTSLIGSYWNKDNSIEIDIVSKNLNNNVVFLGECKFFKSKAVDMRIYHQLKEKSKIFNENQLIYGLFSATGFSKEIIELSINSNHLLLFNNFERLLF